MFFSFGLWNVLLLPFSLKVLGATEFQYGLQEGLTSVGFVVGSFFMARFSRLLPEPAWMTLAMAGMGLCGVLYGISSQVGVAILIVTISGFFNAPSAIARSTLLQRSTPREMRGRVFSAFFVLRDVVFLFGMAAAGLADVFDIRLLVIVSGVLLFGAAGLVLVLPGLGIATWGAAAARLRGATAEGDVALRPGPRRDAGRLRPADRPAHGVQPAVARAARVLPPRRDGPRRAGRHAHRRARRRGIVGVLHPRRRDDGRRAGGRRLPRACRRWRPATSSARSRR